MVSNNCVVVSDPSTLLSIVAVEYVALALIVGNELEIA